MTGPLAMSAAGTALSVTNNATVGGILTVGGNVGIGMTNPTQLLTLDTPEGTRLEIARTSASLPWSQASGDVNPGSFVINQQSQGSSQPGADFALMRDRKKAWCWAMSVPSSAVNKEAISCSSPTGKKPGKRS